MQQLSKCQDFFTQAGMLKCKHKKRLKRFYVFSGVSLLLEKRMRRKKCRFQPALPAGLSAVFRSAPPLEMHWKAALTNTLEPYCRDFFVPSEVVEQILQRFSNVCCPRFSDVACCSSSLSFSWQFELHNRSPLSGFMRHRLCLSSVSGSHLQSDRHVTRKDTITLWHQECTDWSLLCKISCSMFLCLLTENTLNWQCLLLLGTQHFIDANTNLGKHLMNYKNTNHVHQTSLLSII